MLAGWKEFSFFDATPVRDPSPPDSLLYSDPDLLDIVSSTGPSVFMLTRHGWIKEFSEDMQLLRQFAIFSASEDRTPDFVFHVPHTQFLLTASSKLGGPVELKVWDLNAVDKKAADAAAASHDALHEQVRQPPVLHSHTLVNNKTNTFPPAAFTAAADLSVVVVGYTNGSVVVVRGDMLHDRGTRQRHVYTAPSGVTGLHLSPDYSQVFVASLTQICVISTTATKGITVLDKARGADRLCTAGLVASADHPPHAAHDHASHAAHDSHTTAHASSVGTDFVVARDTDVVQYNLQHRGPSFELVFAKRQIFLESHGAYLLIVGIFEPENRSLLTTESVRVVVVDLVNHLIAFNQPLGNGVRTIFEAWGRLNVIGQNGIMYVLREKSWQAQIDLLKQRNLYQVAIQMAERRVEQDKAQAALDETGDDLAQSRILAQRLHQDYADYLYDKNDVDASLKQYILAIGLGQSAHAIRRFKDSRHAAQLLAYLSALFKRGRASPQHVILQIICYTQLDEFEQLGVFLTSAVDEIAEFDFEQAITVLTEVRDTKYYKLAAQLAARYPDPDRVTQIRLRHLNDVKGALDYIQTVSVADALRILIQNSRLMLNRLPVETTGVLITLFTGKFTTRTMDSSLILDRTESSSTTSHPQKDGTAGDEAAISGDEATPEAPLLQSYQAFLNFLGSANYLGSNIVSAQTLEAEVDVPSYLPPRPRLIFPSFIGHDNEFVIFLEACFKAAPQFDSSSKDLNDIATTLFEAYLRVGAKDRASQLVTDHAALLYPVNVFSVSEMLGFDLMVEHQHALGSSYSDIFRRKLAQGDVPAALAVLEYDEPELRLAAPKLIAQSSAALNKVTEEQWLKVLDAALGAGLTYVEVLGDLSDSPNLTVGHLKPFIEQFLTVSDNQIARHEKLAQSYIAEIDKSRATRLGAVDTGDADAAHVDTFRYGACAQCGLQLDLPATHFACEHSYHETCLSAESTDCPRCLPELENAENLAQQAEEAASEEAYFFEELQGPNKQKVVWDFISRGALSKVL